jgi:Big-like domain-containing protein/galactose oxidase-like protein
MPVSIHDPVRSRDALQKVGMTSRNRFQRLSVWLGLVIAIPGQILRAQAPRDIQVYELAPNTDRQTQQKAMEAYKNGHILRVLGTGPEDIARIFGSRLGTFDVSEESRRDALRIAGKEHRPLKLQAAAGYKDANGVIHTVQSFAPEQQPSDPKREQWRKHLDDWIEREQAKAAQASVDDPEPPAQAWTILYTTTVQATSDYDNFEQDTIAIYRLNTTDQQTDYYMVYTIPEVVPAWDGSCNGYDTCGWHTISRSFATQSPQATLLSDHGPTGTIEGESVGFTIGASLEGGQASFSATWSQPSVSTVDASSGTSAQWNETFHFSEVGSLECNPIFGILPGVSTGTFFSRQGAIFQVPGGTTTVNFSVQASAQFCSFTSYIPVGPRYDGVSIQASLLLGPPQLYVAPQSLVVPPGGSGTLLVSAFIPNSPEGFPWTVTGNQSWLEIPGGPFSTGRPIQIGVAAGTALGSTATISVNSVPPFAAPSVETGPIEVPVTVGIPKTENSAGVLLFGGFRSGSQIATSPEYYDIATQKMFPTGQPIYAPFGNSTSALVNGDILITGGATQIPPVGPPPAALNSAELFHPATKTFSATGSMNVTRIYHAATLLPDGKVLITGGRDSNGRWLSSAELYDPATGAFSLTGSMHVARSHHRASVVSQPGQPAQVMVYGGDSGPTFALSSFEIWSEATGAFSSPGSMITAATGFPQPRALGNGDLVVAGGYDNNLNSLKTEQLINPSTQSFQAGSDLNVARQEHSLTALPGSNNLVAIGGMSVVQSPYSSQTLGSAEVRDANGWTLVSGTNSCPNVGCLLTPRSLHTSTLLPNGTVLVAGGQDSNGDSLGSIELFDPSTKTFSSGPQAAPRAGHSATLFATSSTDFSASPNPATLGQEVTLVASVTALTGTPTGTVQFFDGSTLLKAVPLSKGQATFSTSTLSIGSHSLSAAYSGGEIPASSTSPALTEVINKRSTTVTLSSSPNPSAFGQQVTFVASLTPAAASGTVTFKDGSAVLGTGPVTNGASQLRSINLAVGQHGITAIYSGDASDNGSTSPIFTQTVATDTTSTALRIVPKNSSYGQNLTFMARVTSLQGIPTGTVSFKTSTGDVLGSAPLVSGVATLQSPLLSAGAYKIVATYNGSSNYSSSSVLVSLSISRATPVIALSSSLNPSNTGVPVVFTAKLSYSTGTPSGTVVFKDGATSLGSVPAANGVAALSVPNLAAGTHVITAAYSGDTNFNAVTSVPLSQVVNRSTPQITLTPSLTTSNYGQPVVFTAAVSSPTGKPSGSVSFFDANTLLGTKPLVSGTAAVTVSTLIVGPHSIKAAYSGDSVFTPVTSAPLTFIVNTAKTTVSVTSSINPSMTGEKFTLTATVATPYGTPTGSVTFTDQSQTLGVAQLVSGKANIVTYYALPGTRYITAQYSGDANYQGSTSPPYPQQVNVTSQSVGQQ